jgi:hypothetical protein
MEQETKIPYRQGDVGLYRIEELPEGAEPVDGMVVALGEVTGHSHKIEGEGNLFKKAGKLFARIVGKATLVHDEHAPIPLVPGLYEVRIQREHRPRGFAFVKD